MDEETRLSIDSPDAPLLGPRRRRVKQRQQQHGYHIITSRRGISLVACCAVFLWVLSGMIAMVPSARIAEDIFCRRYYNYNNKNENENENPIEESKCKLDEIQSSMAWLFGLEMAISGFVGLVAVLPFGVLADRARKRVYLLGATGQLASVVWSLVVLRFWRVEMILLGPVFGFLGGGLQMAIVVLYAVISDVNESEDRAIMYFFASLAANLAVFVGPPLASKMMDIWGPWVPMLLCLLITFMAGGLILLIPETAAAAAAQKQKQDSSEEENKEEPWLQKLQQSLPNFHTLLKNHHRIIPLLIIFTLIAPLPIAMGPLFLQYYSTRFNRPLKEAGYILAIRGGLTVVVLGIILPLLSKSLTRLLLLKRKTNIPSDLILAQISAAFVLTGYILLGSPHVLPGIIFLSLSTGLAPLCRSLVSRLVNPEQMSQVFTIVSIVEGIGALPAGPFLAWTFSLGMRVGGVWVGLPFFVLAALGALVFGVLFLVYDFPDLGRNETELFT
ncbi:MFS general substrate transporter [Poronia punctata]|nr:MFS general substrate transporter [Poronia punctata]